MASELQDTLKRLIGKSEVLIEKYNVLKAEKDAVDNENAKLKADINALKVRVESLEQDCEFLRIARVVSVNREELERNRAMLGKLVQDIDKCISQLMD